MLSQLGVGWSFLIKWQKKRKMRPQRKRRTRKKMAHDPPKTKSQPAKEGELIPKATFYTMKLYLHMPTIQDKASHYARFLC